MSGAGKVVCVTGASGYIASYLVKLLLQSGYTVKASLRDPKDPDKTQHLLSLDGAKERLHLFKADLMEEGSFDSVVNDSTAQLIDPALKGTLNVLRSCIKVPSLYLVIDETWVSDPAFCEESKLWYSLSKTLAEEAAWKFARENGIDLVSINPGFVIGPLLQPTLNLSSELIGNLLNGAQTFPNLVYRFVDIRDVALTHIQAFEVASASGRYCVVGNVVHISEALNILHQLYPTLNIPEKCEDDKPPMPTYRISKEKAKSLGTEFTPLEVSLRDTVEFLKEKGFLNV